MIWRSGSGIPASRISSPLPKGATPTPTFCTFAQGSGISGPKRSKEGRSKNG